MANDPFDDPAVKERIEQPGAKPAENGVKGDGVDASAEPTPPSGDLRAATENDSDETDLFFGARHKAMGSAAKRLRMLPDFIRVKLQMRERMEEAQRGLPLNACFPGTQERLEYVLKLLDIRADSLLELVSDIHTQMAYTDVLDGAASQAWIDFTGFPIELLRPDSAQSDADALTIDKRAERWKHESEIRLQSLRVERGKPETAPNPGAVAPSQPETAERPNRSAWLKGRLLERGWSTSDPYRFRGPDRKTVEKILRGEAVRNESLEKLAEALSKKHSKVKVLDIPDR